MGLWWSWNGGWRLDMDDVLETALSYFQGDSIWCKDGSKSFPRERLNDNFCDCPDGTDEPGMDPLMSFSTALDLHSRDCNL